MAQSLVSPKFIEEAKGAPVQMLPVTSLQLDLENPRLRLSPNATQKQALKQLVAEHRLRELMASLLANGYFDEEPLVAVPATRKDHYIVVEGNRRLAALKLLTDPDLTDVVSADSLPPATKEQLDRLLKVPVKVYQKREYILPYLGFRHITGIKEWDAESKARYVFQLKHNNKLNLDEIATMIGDTYKMTERLYLGWSLIDQAQKESIFSQNEVYKFPFSYMYDAVRMPEVKQFLGLKDNEYKVNPKKLNELSELTRWLFGNKPKQQQPIVDKKEQLKELAYAVSDPSGLKALRAGRPLEEAYRMTIGERDQLAKWLTEASANLDQAKGVIHRHKKETDIKSLVARCNETISSIMRELGS